MPVQVHHKVEREVEYQSVGNFVGQIGQHRSDGFARRVVESIAGVLFDDRTLGVQGKNLEWSARASQLE